MEESFKLLVHWNGCEQEVDITLRVTGFSPRFIALVSGKEVIIEKDEDGSYRAINYSQDASSSKDREFVIAIVITLQTVFGS